MYDANHAHTRRRREATQEQALARVKEALIAEEVDARLQRVLGRLSP
jgi:hypothetical protein